MFYLKNNYIIIYKYSMQAFKNLLTFSLLSITGTGLYWHFYPKYFNENRRKLEDYLLSTNNKSHEENIGETKKNYYPRTR